MADNQQTFSFASDVVLQVIDGEALMLKLQDEVVFSLNETGARIAELIAEGQTLAAMIDILGREYGTTKESVAPEVQRLVDTLQSKRLIVVSHTARVE